jgi:hypothetical protein
MIFFAHETLFAILLSHFSTQLSFFALTGFSFYRFCLFWMLELSFIIPIYPKKCKKSEESKEKVVDLGWKSHFCFFKLS